MKTNPRFLALVETKGYLSSLDSKNLLAKHHGDAFAVFLYLAEGGAAPAGELEKLWGDSLGYAYVDLDKTLFQQDVVQKLPLQVAQKHKMIPLYQLGPAVTLAMVDPADAQAAKEAEKHLGAAASPVFSMPRMIQDAIEIQYQTTTALTGFIAKIAESSLLRPSTEITAHQLKELAEDQSVVELTKGLMLLAVRERASDIHIEPEENRIRIRFRVDGVLQERMKIEKILHRPLVSRLKILADVDIIERRRPQDGRITLALSNKSLDFRFSTVPTIYGEKIVLRVLGQSQNRDAPDLADIDLSKSCLEKVRRVTSSPNGVFFVTGPTGSGKTTTLFSVLKHLNTPGINIMTVEDPVEYRLPGLNQVQVNPDIGLDFAKALRAFLRQDPNVILIGEIRDMETAKIASQAALTGHLVLATMHTNNALQAVTRLVEIGVEPFLVAPSIIGVMAQRLVRRLCDYCKERYILGQDEKEVFFRGNLTREVAFYRPRGCSKCDGLGYRGRLPIHEVFIMNDRIRSMVARGASILDIQEEARTSGFKTMRYDGLKKVLRGLTSLTEVERATAAEEESPGF
ncbi:MAG: GspE/PulE family protein [Pseudomonadota bacterium]